MIRNNITDKLIPIEIKYGKGKNPSRGFTVKYKDRVEEMYAVDRDKFLAVCLTRLFLCSKMIRKLIDQQAGGGLHIGLDKCNKY